MSDSILSGSNVCGVGPQRRGRQPELAAAGGLIGSIDNSTRSSLRGSWPSTSGTSSTALTVAVNFTTRLSRPS